jgi:radical SAM protein with 4Fe4S-binding SPASM domain
MRSPLNIFLSVRKARQAQKAGIARCEHLPHRLIVETSSLCDLRCPMCLVSGPIRLPSGNMKLDLFKQIIDQSASFVCEIDLSHRGEPLSNPNLVPMIAYATEKRIATCLSTNATRLTEELSLRLIQSGLRSIIFPVDGLDRESYERVRVGARFDEVVENIVAFLRIKRGLRAKYPACTIEALDLPDAPIDENRAARFLRGFRSLPLDGFVVRKPRNWAGAIHLGEKPDASPVSRNSYYGCPYIWNTMVVLWDGSVALCPQDWYNDNPLGNVPDSTLEGMWNGWTLTFVRQLLANREYNQIEVCSQCDLLWRPPETRTLGIWRRKISPSRFPRSDWLSWRRQ